MSLRLGSSGLQGYDLDRFETQRLALERGLEKPLGFGPGQAEVLFAVVTHSTYIRVLFENGVIGFAAMTLFLLFSLTRSIRLAVSLRDPRGKMLFTFTAACIGGYLVNSAVIDTLHWRHIWLFLALAWTSTRVFSNLQPAASPQLQTARFSPPFSTPGFSSRRFSTARPAWRPYI
jgi:O-antigen ligase